jgi:hypothetical protein
MYQAYQTYWLGAGFLVCVGLAVVLAALAQFKKLKLRKSAFFLLIVAAMLLMMTKSWLRVSDNDQLRLELKEINPLFVSNLVVRADGGSRDIMSTNKNEALFKQLQRVEAVPAHHSHPTDSFEVKFEGDGHEYRYRLGRDSDRTNEYWMFETTRAGTQGREIGRVQSTQLGPMLEQLVTSKP